MTDPIILISYHRQRSSTARIRDGQIVLRISNMVSRREQQEHIDHLLKQVRPKLERLGSRVKLSLRSVFQEGEILLSTGVHYQIIVKKAAVRNYKIQKIGKKLIVSQPIGDEFDGALAEDALWKFLAKDQIGVVAQRLDMLRRDWIEENFSAVRWRMASSRWGSCDKRSGVIMLSLKLLLVEPKLLDYVCIHELAHLKYADHSDLFWDLVARRMPEWKVQRRRLRRYE